VDELDEWDQYEEDGPMDLEDQLDAALERAFPDSAGTDRG